MGYIRFPPHPGPLPGERENGPPPLDHTRAGVCPITIGKTPIRQIARSRTTPARRSSLIRGLSSSSDARPCSRPDPFKDMTLLLRRGRVDDRFDFGNAVGREAALLRVFTDQLFV